MSIAVLQEMSGHLNFQSKVLLVWEIFSVRLGGECKKSFFMHEVGGGMIGRAGNGGIFENICV